VFYRRSGWLRGLRFVSVNQLASLYEKPHPATVGFFFLPIFAAMQNQSKYLFRFVLEILALVFIGWWASTWAASWVGVFYSFAAVAGTMMVWGIFNVPGDESRSGKAPVVVPGWVRIGIEICVFLFATVSIYYILGWIFALLFLAATTAHYIHTKHRISWLLKN